MKNVSHPPITCAIPATGNVHLEGNMQGGFGKSPDAKMRARMLEAVS